MHHPFKGPNAVSREAHLMNCHAPGASRRVVWSRVEIVEIPAALFFAGAAEVERKATAGAGGERGSGATLASKVN